MYCSIYLDCVTFHLSNCSFKYFSLNLEIIYQFSLLNVVLWFWFFSCSLPYFKFFSLVRSCRPVTTWEIKTLLLFKDIRTSLFTVHILLYQGFRIFLNQWAKNWNSFVITIIESKWFVLNKPRFSIISSKLKWWKKALTNTIPFCSLKDASAFQREVLHFLSSGYVHVNYLSTCWAFFTPSNNHQFPINLHLTTIFPKKNVTYQLDTLQAFSLHSLLMVMFSFILVQFSFMAKVLWLTSTKLPETFSSLASSLFSPLLVMNF